MKVSPPLPGFLLAGGGKLLPLPPSASLNCFHSMSLFFLPPPLLLSLSIYPSFSFLSPSPVKKRKHRGCSNVTSAGNAETRYTIRYYFLFNTLFSVNFYLSTSGYQNGCQACRWWASNVSRRSVDTKTS